MPLEQCRLRRYTAYTDSPINTYTGKEESSLAGLGLAYYVDFLLETREPDVVFADYDPLALNFKVHLARANGTVTAPVRVPLRSQSTLGDLKEGLSKSLGAPASKVIANLSFYFRHSFLTPLAG